MDGSSPPQLVPFGYAPPHDEKAEAALLAALLLTPELSVDLLPEHFYLDCNEQVYRAVLAVPDRDITLVADCLRAAGKMYRIGGALYLAELLDTKPAWDVEAFAWRVREAWRARRLIAVLAQVQCELYAGVTGADEAWRRVKECAA